MPAPDPLSDPFAGPGEVAHDLRAVDWSATPLGPPDSWPLSLRTVVRTMLASRFSMWMGWGPQLTFFCNAAYRRDTLGSKYPWALGRPAHEVWAEIWTDIGPRIDTVLRTGDATWDEALQLFLERSGYVEESYHTFSYSPLADDTGAVVGLLCVVTEDTERVIAARHMALLRDLAAEATELRSEEEFYPAVAATLAGAPESLPFTATYVYDTDRAVARLAGASGVRPGAGPAPAELVLDDPGARWPAALLRDGGVRTVDLAGAADLPTGVWSEPPTTAVLVPLREQGQREPFGFVVVGANRYRPLDADYVSFLELVAGQLAAGVSSARAYDAARRRADALAELDRAKTAFFTNISHEFRTPLTLLLGPAEDALSDTRAPLPPVQRARLEVVARNGQRLLRLVNSLLDFNRLASGELSGRFEPVDLAAETAALASTFRSATDRVGLSLDVITTPLPAPVYVDREMWATVVLNLLSNAVKFTFDGGITVRVGHDAGGAVVAVADTGTGIAAGDQARLFERFHRVVGARSRSHEGSGIGLALVAELVAVHGGEVALASAPGQGSTFTVRLPFGHDHLPAAQVGHPATGTSARHGGAAPGAGPGAGPDPGATMAVERLAEGFVTEASRWLGGPAPAAAEGPAVATDGSDLPRVLVADDNADMRDYVTGVLAGSYAVSTATDGLQALELARGGGFDLLLTDVMMPGLDGFGLLAALRADDATAQLPVVMLSARAADEAAVEGLEAGADDYLIKPFTARELRARVRANLELDRVRRHRAELERSRSLLDQAQRLAHVGSWELDVATGRLHGSPELFRILGIPERAVADLDVAALLRDLTHPDDAERVTAALAATGRGAPLDLVSRAVVNGAVRTLHTLAAFDPDLGAAGRIRGSVQDVTEQRAAQEVRAQAAALAEAASREQRIADELQASLLPARSFDPDHLRVATFYRAGVAGTQVGGDWYDVIELGAGRTALVIGDVMGRGVRAAAVMGQLRAALRAYARLDLTPSDVLEFLDGVVRDLGDDHIVTCVYAVYDPGDGVLSYANAGHLPPLLLVPGRGVRPLTAGGPPLGTGGAQAAEGEVAMPPGTVLTLYTDGLVETRDRDIDAGVAELAAHVLHATADVPELPAALVAAMADPHAADDIAVLVAEVQDLDDVAESLLVNLPDERQAVRAARGDSHAALLRWGVPVARAEEIVLLVSELVTNAVIHGRPPVTLRLRANRGQVVLDVRDHATYLPRRLRPGVDDEHGRGLQLVSLLAERWGTRPLADGKSVWCLCHYEWTPPR